MYITGRWGFKLLCLIWGRVDTCIFMVEFLLCSPGSLTILLVSHSQVKKQQLELDMEQQTGYRLGKEYLKAVHCHFAY